MRLTLRSSTPQPEPPLLFGAVVIRPAKGGGLMLDFGPADGAVQAQLHLTIAESNRLAAGLRTAAASGDELVILAES